MAARFRRPLVLVVVLTWAATALGLPGASASWTATTSGSNSAATKKVMATTVSNNFLDWNDATNGAPGLGLQQSKTTYLDGVSANTNFGASMTFDPQYYEEFDFAGTDLPPGVAVGNVVFHFAIGNGGAGETSCFYLA